MANTELKIDVTASPTLEAAQRCLKVVEWFMNDNPHLKIVVDRKSYTDRTYDHYCIKEV